MSIELLLTRSVPGCLCLHSCVWAAEAVCTLLREQRQPGFRVRLHASRLRSPRLHLLLWRAPVPQAPALLALGADFAGGDALIQRVAKG